MSEKYNFTQSRGNNTWFNKLLLNGDVESLVRDQDFDPSSMEIKLTVNGHIISIKEYNEYMDEITDKLLDIVKQDLDYLKTEQAVVDKAEELIKNKLGKINDVLSEIEYSLYKLED